MNVVNEPEVSKTVVWLYGVLVVFLAAVMVFFIFAAFFTPLGLMGVGAAIVVAFVEVIMLLLLRSLYKTRYILGDDELVVKTTKLIGGNKRISLKTISSLEATFIPYGIRLFGASFHGGYYQIPGLGRTFLAITNFHDGLLVKTKNGNYIITPKNRMDFKEAIETKMI